MKLSDIQQLHHQAMDLAGRAFAARRLGNPARALDLFRQALDFERRAAEAMDLDWVLEPTRSVLYRSAATLALDCEELSEAERLAGAALAGNPPPEIKGELHELLQEVRFRRRNK